MNSFERDVQAQQIRWRESYMAADKQQEGIQNRISGKWILPVELWEEGLWPGIRRGSANSLPDYLTTPGKEVERHKGSHNLKSSWMLCANLYFPFRQDHGMLAGFLKQHVSPTIEAVDGVELEYEDEDDTLKPPALLGEPDGGHRGANQTSPDVAFMVRTTNGKGLILTENKFTEPEFYGCSGYDHKTNPDHTGCLSFQKLMTVPGLCWQRQWESGTRKNRKYWDHLLPILSDKAKSALSECPCPAAKAGCQLLRQQALAEGIAASGKYGLVVSCVAYDDRNQKLIGCLKDTGIDDFTKDWAALFNGKAEFATFTHQQWVTWVREHDEGSRWADWIKYVESRYGY